MNWWRRIGIGLATVGALVLIVSFVGRQVFASKAQVVQRVQPSSGAELFGDVGEKIGKPESIILNDPKAFLEGKSEDGFPMVNEAYLKEHKIYPLQLKSVEFVSTVGMVGGGVGFVLGVVLLRMGLRQRRA